ncbi:MAG: hypothetical protein JWM37_560 [Candidatus Saccharibacteria bacterium]|nr:hypothetical protein [Candidatus Saccharibacteria bacterium]
MKKDMVKKQIRAILIVLVALFAGVITPVAQAATTTQSVAPTSNTNNGLKISPVRRDVIAQAGATTTVEVTVQNVQTGTANLRAVVNDFIASANESGQPALILDENQYAASHSLKRFVGPIPNVTLKPNEAKNVKVNIIVPKNAAAGGYYGAVRFLPADNNVKNNVVLSASLGSLILVRVPGDIHESLSVASLDVRNQNVARKLFTTPKDLTAVLRFQNQGDIQVEPFGNISVRDMHGKEVMRQEINNTDPRGNVLPDSVRRFDVALKSLGKFGKYTIQGSFGYGTTGQLVQAKTTFYVVPLPLIITVGVIILLIILGIIFIPKAIKGYNRRILRNARSKK